MTSKELERLERIAAQLLAGLMAKGHGSPVGLAEQAIEHAQVLIRQLDALLNHRAG